MRKTVSRRVEFSADDVKLALLEFMEKRDHRAPAEIDAASQFELTEDGAVLVWTEIT